jgi:metal-responsive CopG/Arc/MetJ family transcriptional regulator
MPMKVAVSIPDPLFEEAERVAQRLRIPRSQLYSRALQAFVRSNSGQDITDRMNAALERVGEAEDPGWENPGLEVVRRETW